MKRNRSIPQATVIPVLIYPDVREAVDWLSRAFGFVERVRIGEIPPKVQGRLSLLVMLKTPAHRMLDLPVHLARSS